jgi:hypothetical protein
MQAQRATLSSTEIELYGRQIAHHIVAAKRHQEKRDEHKKSAALLLIAVKEQLPHGEYGKWLAANAISQDIANRLVQQFTDPEAATQRLAAERQRQAEMRQAASKFRKFAEPDDYPSRKGDVEAPPQQPQPSRPAATSGVSRKGTPEADCRPVHGTARPTDSRVCGDAGMSADDATQRKFVRHVRRTRVVDQRMGAPVGLECGHATRQDCAGHVACRRTHEAHRRPCRATQDGRTEETTAGGMAQKMPAAACPHSVPAFCPLTRLFS